VNVRETAAPVVSATPPPAKVLVIASPPADAPALADFAEEDPHGLIEEAQVPHTPVPQAAAVPVSHGSRRLRHAAILALAGFALIMAGLAANEWELRREELTHPVQLPPVPPPPKQHLRSGAAPVIPPADSFAYVIP